MVVLLALATSASGCKREPQRYRHEIVAGTIEVVKADTGELVLSTAPLRGQAEETVSCLLTNAAEVYINDRFAAVKDLRTGDAIEVLGYRDPSPQTERLVVSLANVVRPEPAPRTPERPAPATR